MESGELARRYQAAIEDELGVIAKIDSDGNVVFKAPQFGSLCVFIDEEDPSFFRLVRAELLEDCHFNGDRSLLYFYANEATRTTKVAKVAVIEQDHELCAIASAQMFISASGEMPSDAMIRAVLGRCLKVVLLVTKQFNEFVELHLNS
jgi:hypothetical protein